MKLALNREIAQNLLIPISFIIPFFILYCLDPDLFSATWKGRTFYIFFLWLIILELWLSWDELRKKRLESLEPKRKLALGILLFLPTVYVIIANYLGLNEAILSLSMSIDIPLNWWMPLSVEYIVFTALFVAITILAYGREGLRIFTISAFFLGAIASVYTIDNLYPEGRFTPFQMFVPSTASSAAQVLEWMGYKTYLTLNARDGMPYLAVFKDTVYTPLWGALIGWPCAGVQSLLIYTFTMLLFFKKTSIPSIHKAIYFFVGAVCTYIINILRIVSIFLIAINEGEEAARLFHDYYGELYAITWILVYPLIIIVSRVLWRRLNPKMEAAWKRLVHPSSKSAMN